MLKRSSMAFRAGLLLIVVGLVFSMPSALAVSGAVPELGDAWNSPMSVVLGAIAVLGGAALVGGAFRLRRQERPGSAPSRERVRK